MHAHAGFTNTTWLDFDLATRHARAIATALSRKRPALRQTFERRYAALARDLKALDQTLSTMVSKHPQRALVASHPVYDYLARRYGLHLKSVHWEPDVMPNEGQWAQLQDLVTTHPATWMIWEAEPLPAAVARLASIGMHSLVFAPCANAPPQGDFLSIMRQNVENLRQAFR
jgi:zinc transport system substrate-binding protein